MSVYDSASSIDMYLNEISRIPLLTKEQEYEIAMEIVKFEKEVTKAEKALKTSKSKTNVKRLQEARRAYEKSFNKMIQGNYRLVVSVAKKYYNSFLQLTDLIEEGNLGLIKAVKKFNPKRGYRFSTFAIWWIRQSIVKSIRDKGKTVKIPVYVEKNVEKYRGIIKAHREAFGRDPDTNTLKKKMHMSEKKLHSLSNIPESFISLNYTIGDSENEVGDLIIDETIDCNPVEKTIEGSLEGTLAGLLDKLNDREKKIIIMRYGLNNNEPMVLEKIGKVLGVTRERVRQIHSGALRKMREMGNKANLEVFLNS